MAKYYLNSRKNLVTVGTEDENEIGSVIVNDLKDHLLSPEYGAKNHRMVQAILTGDEPVVLLFPSERRDHSVIHYALVVIGADRMPMPVLLEIFGVDPKTIIQRHFEVFIYKILKPTKILNTREFQYGNGGDLLKDILSAMLESIKADPSGQGYWDLWETDYRNSLSITVTFSRDPSRSRNGGEYEVYRTFDVVDNGVLAETSWSCDIQGYDRPNAVLYRIDLKSLKEILETAEGLVRGIQGATLEHVCPHCGHKVELEFDLANT